MAKKTPAWTSAGVTHPGHVRTTNEDAFLDSPQARIWAVADGMGGHTAGDVASRTVVEALAQIGDKHDAPATLEELVTDAENALLDANARLVALALEQHQTLIGSTIAVLVSAGEHVVCLWAGDSRIYRYRPTGRHNKSQPALMQLTQDHAVVEELMQVGLLERDDADFHPHANRITRAIGASGALFVDMEIYALQAGDRFVICSDGLYKELSVNDIVGIVAAQEDNTACAQALLDKALNRGARDNTSVVVMRYGSEI